VNEGRWFQSTIWTEVERARSGESTAYLGFVNRYRPAMVGYFRGHGADPEDAEDLAQEVFLNIVRSGVLSKVSPEKGRFRSLLLAIAKHVAANEIRARKRLKRGGGRVLVPIDPEELPQPTSEEEEEFDRAWVRQLMASALSDLESAHSRHYRAIRISLEGRSQTEIADEMGCTVAAANNFVHRAKAFIRKRVGQLVAESCRSEADYPGEAEHLSRYLD